MAMLASICKLADGHPTAQMIQTKSYTFGNLPLENKLKYQSTALHSPFFGNSTPKKTIYNYDE